MRPRRLAARPSSRPRPASRLPAPRPPRPATGLTRRPARRRCSATPGHLGVVRRDDRPGHRAAGRQPRRRRDAERPDVDHEHRRLHVEHARRRAARDHRPRARRSRGSTQTLRSLETMERHEPSGQFYNWYDHTTGAEADGLAAHRRPAHADPVVRRQRLAGDRRCRSSPTASPSCRRAPRRCSTAWTSASTTGRTSTGSLFHYAPSTGAVAVLLRHDRQREPDRELHRDRQGRAPGEGVLRRLADVPRHLRLELAGDQAGRLPPHLPRRRRLRGRLPVRRTAASSRAGAAACSRRSCRRCSCPRSSGARAAGRSTTR